MMDVEEKIVKYYKEREIDFIEKNNKTWITSRAIAEGLEIDRTNINQIFHNNKELLEPYSAVMKIITPQGTRQNTRIFDKTGFFGICLRSNSPRALPFQKWVLKVIDEIDKKGYYIDAGSDIFPIIGQLVESVSDLRNDLLTLKGRRRSFTKKKPRYSYKEAIECIKPIIEFFRKNEEKYTQYRDVQYRIILTKDFLDSYNKYAMRKKELLLKNLTSFSAIESAILKREIKATAIRVRNINKQDDMKQVWGVHFYIDELERIFEQN